MAVQPEERNFILLGKSATSNTKSNEYNNEYVIVRYRLALRKEKNTRE